MASIKTHWVSLKEAPSLYWHNTFFAVVGAELGNFIKLSPATLNKVNLTEAWLKIVINKVPEVSRVLQIKFPEGVRTVEVKVFSSNLVPLRAFSGFSFSMSSHASLINRSTILLGRRIVGSFASRESRSELLQSENH